MSFFAQNAQTKLFALASRAYVWLEGQTAPTSILGQGKSKALSAADDACIHAFWSVYVSCKVYAGAFEIFASGTSTSLVLQIKILRTVHSNRVNCA
jgi:hypothetical protein